MALTQKMLKAMGIEDEKADEIIEAHRDHGRAQEVGSLTTPDTKLSFDMQKRPASQQSASFMLPWCSLWGSNPRPFAPEANALIH